MCDFIWGWHLSSPLSGFFTTLIHLMPWSPDTRTSWTVCRIVKNFQNWNKKIFNSGSRTAEQSVNDLTVACNYDLRANNSNFIFFWNLTKDKSLISNMRTLNLEKFFLEFVSLQVCGVGVGCVGVHAGWWAWL